MKRVARDLLTAAFGRTSAESVLAFLLAVVPFCVVIRWPPNPGFWGQWAAVLVALLWIALRLPSVRAVPQTAFVFLALALLLLLHSAVGIAAMPMATTLAAVTALIAGVACTATYALDDDRLRETCLRAFGWGLIVALLANAAAVVLGWLGYEVHFHRIVEVPSVPTRALGLIGQSNHLGMLSVLAIFAGWMLKQRGALSRSAFWAVALIAAVVCASTASRVAMLVFALLLVLAWALRRSAADAPVARGGDTKSLAVVALLFLSIQVFWAWTMAGQGSAHTPSIVRPSAGRSEMLGDAVAMWLSHPILGIGNGNFAAGRLHELDGPLHAPHADNAHNLLAQALAEWGAIGAVIVLAGMVLATLLVWRQLRDRSASPESGFACAWIVAMLVHSQLEQPLWFMHWLLPTAFVLGSMRQRVVMVRSEASPRRGVSVAYGVAAAALMGAVAWDYQRSETLALVMLAEHNRPSGVPSQVTFGDVAKVEAFTLFPQYARIMLSRKLPLGDSAAAAKLTLARQAMNAVPNSETIARYCAFAVIAGDTQSAYSMLESLRRRSPPGYYQQAYELLTSWRGVDGRIERFVMRLPAPEVGAVGAASLH